MDNASEGSYKDGVYGKRLGEEIIRGINSSKSSYAGPHLIQLDITNDCNFNCAGCWCHSELLGESRFKGKKKTMHMDLATIERLARELKLCSVDRIILSGSGDPLMHPDFLNAAKLIRDSGIDLDITTNFSLVTKEMIKDLLGIGIGTITVSLWAGTKETYARLHPNQNEKTFLRIIDNLKYLYSQKKDDRLPKVRIYNVISSLNCHEIEEMVKTSLEVKADFVEFQAIDIIPGKTESLALSKADVESIITQFEGLRARENYFDDLAGPDRILHHKREDETKEFGRFYKNTMPQGFVFENLSLKLRCPSGFISSRRLLNEETGRSFFYTFDEKMCRACKNHAGCPGNGKNIQLEFLNLLGHGSFSRRINSSDGIYDANIVDRIPCLIGWTYARILPDGNVIPCCKAHRHPLGNINEKSFRDIWYSGLYDEFRQKAKALRKSDKYFRKINCYKSCDNVGMNLETLRQLCLADPAKKSC